jgi:nucleotide-binding universal stress UspA family protein
MANDIKKILVPIDFSECSDAAFEMAVAIRERFDAILDLVHVWAAPVYAGTEAVVVHTPEGTNLTLAQYVHGQAEEEMREFMKRVESRAIPKVSARVLSGDPVDLIVKEGAGHDLIVMGTHGRGAIAHLFLGSVAERVVRRAKCPVMTVHAPPPSR